MIPKSETFKVTIAAAIAAGVGLAGGGTLSSKQIDATLDAQTKEMVLDLKTLKKAPTSDLKLKIDAIVRQQQVHKATNDGKYFDYYDDADVKVFEFERHGKPGYYIDGDGWEIEFYQNVSTVIPVESINIATTT